MSKQKLALTAPEWMVMSALWGRDPQVLGEIIASIGGRTDWSYNTYASYLKILRDKGFVGYHTRGRMKFYYPLIPREACIESEGERLLDKLGSEDAEALLLCMVKKGGLSREGQARMRALVDALAKEETP